MFHYALQIIDTGEEIYSEYSERSMAGWHKITERRLLKDGRRSAKVKQAIETSNTIVALLNFEEVGYVPKIFKGYDSYFNDRLLLTDGKSSG